MPACIRSFVNYAPFYVGFFVLDFRFHLDGFQFLLPYIFYSSEKPFTDFNFHFSHFFHLILNIFFFHIFIIFHFFILLTPIYVFAAVTLSLSIFTISISPEFYTL